MSPGGRRPGNSGSREAILDAARDSFGRSGYDATSIRSIARAAGVDPALVHHFFGSKEAVFTAAMALPVDPARIIAEVLEPGHDGIGERLVRRFLSLWEAPATRVPLLGLIRSAVSHDQAAALLRQFMTSAVLGRIAAGIDRPDPELRATLCGSQLVGLAMVRYVVKVEPLASTDPEVIVRLVAPTLQRYLTGDLVD
jgi:AcrR family transcriptional regulator